MPLFRTTRFPAKQMWLASASALVLGLAQSAPAQDAETQFPHQNQPSQNFYGLPGLIDTPSAEALPDGQFTITSSYFAGISRNTISFQFAPRLTGSFRYAGIKDLNIGGYVDYRDRSFDLRYQAIRETRIMPAVAIGLQDFAGTGIYSGEYVVATKTFQQPLNLPGTIKLSAGVGWGRLAKNGVFDAARPGFTPGGTGGELSYDTWFRGKASPFAGVEWQVNDRFGLKVEYSADTYDRETRQGVLTRDSNVNFGAEYQVSDRFRLGAYYLYGSEFGINAQLQLNPKAALTPSRVSGPRALVLRPERRVNPDAWRTDWAGSQTAAVQLRDIMAPKLAEDGIELQKMSVTATTAELRVANRRYSSEVPAIGRTARVMAEILPPSVETFRITPMENGLPLATVVIRRSDLEALEFQPQAADRLLAVTGINDASPTLPDSVTPVGTYPKFSYSLGPYVEPSYFDPDRPVRADFGAEAQFNYRFAQGWLISGALRHRLAGNVGDSARLSNSVLPRVRTDAILYSRGSDTYLNNLYISKQWKAGPSTYARVTAGYLERMFGGISGEVLWKPTSSRLALGVEANYVKQREFDGGAGFRNYSVATGHVSAYYDIGKGYHAQLDVGRYLAGDVGATATLSREFANGWKVGGFFTLTDVSSTDFGEGSFDKGIVLTVPVKWFIGTASKRTISTTIRPIQRDGGARLSVPGRLYEQVRKGDQNSLSNDWSRVWE